MGTEVVAKDLIAGTMAGAAQLLVGHPFDTIKVKLQSQPQPPPGESLKYSGAIDAVRKTLVSEGPKGLFKGMGAPLATVAISNAVLFAARGQVESLLKPREEEDDSGSRRQLSASQQMIAGAGAGFAVSFVACPTELVKCKLQAQSALARVTTVAAAAAGGGGGAQQQAAAAAAGTLLSQAQYSGPLDVARQVLRFEGGVLGLFKGLTPTLLREVPGNAAMFGVYEAVKQMLAGGKETSSLRQGSQILAGGVAGAAFWLCVYPTDVIKSVIQVDDFRNPKYSGTMDAFCKVYASEGVKGLFRGFGPAMARSIPANAACFLAYELVKESLGVASSSSLV